MKGKKTFAFFMLALLIAIADFFGFGSFELTGTSREIYILAVPAIGLVLRYLTDTKIFKK